MCTYGSTLIRYKGKTLHCIRVLGPSGKHIQETSLVIIRNGGMTRNMDFNVYFYVFSFYER